MPTERTTGLTATEVVIADLVARGRSNAEVAGELGISPRTVEWNLTRIYRKLGVRTRGQLAERLSRAATPWAEDKPQ